MTDISFRICDLLGEESVNYRDEAVPVSSGKADKAWIFYSSVSGVSDVIVEYYAPTVGVSSSPCFFVRKK